MLEMLLKTDDPGPRQVRVGGRIVIFAGGVGFGTGMATRNTRVALDLPPTTSIARGDEACAGLRILRGSIGSIDAPRRRV